MARKETRQEVSGYRSESMHDYRLRHRDLKLESRRRSVRRMVLAASGLIIFLVALYAGLRMVLPRSSTEPQADSDPDIVPLPLPPQPPIPKVSHPEAVKSQGPT